VPRCRSESLGVGCTTFNPLVDTTGSFPSLRSWTGRSGSKGWIRSPLTYSGRIFGLASCPRSATRGSTRVKTTEISDPAGESEFP
jgi:hypothetical protein